MNNQSNSNGSISDIEREIDQDRSHFADTLSALENKLSPGQLVDQALGYAKKNGGDFSDNLVRTISNNPIPTILTGIGVAWMAIQGRSNHPPGYNSSDRYYETGSHNGSGSKLSGMRDKASQLKGGLSDSVHRAGDQAHHLADGARNSAHDMSDRGRHQWERTSNSARNFFEENPLAVGAAAIAIGALIGAALPVTSRERELLGHSGEQAISRAKSMASDAKHTASEAGKAGMEAAKAKAKESKTTESSPQ